MDSKRKDALIKIILWIIFIVALVLFINVNGGKDTLDEVNEEEETEIISEFLNYEDMQEELINSNYTFKYEIKLDENKIIINGVKNNEGILGYKEEVDKITKYKIDTTGIYEIKLDELNQIDYIYEDYYKTYLDIELLFNNLKEYLYSIDEADNERTITYTKEGYQVSVTTNLKQIESINLLIDNLSIVMYFSNVGE